MTDSSSASYRTLQLRNALLEAGACLVGFADVSDIKTDITEQYPFGICFALEYDRAVIAQMPEDERFVQMSLRLSAKAKELYGICMDLLDTWGYRHKKITSNVEPNEFSVLCEELPQKTLATLSGLGWIGKSSLLISPEFGPRIRLGTLLTDAPLVPDAPVTSSRCGRCTACVDACPVSAIRGSNWSPGVARDTLLDVRSCNQHLWRHKATLRGRETCGICLKACPVGGL